MHGALVRILWSCSVAAAAAAPSGGGEELEPVEQSIADISALSTSLRQVQTGLGQPRSFEQVYRFGDGYVRAQGGLYAVFNNSVYARDKEGRLKPVVPAGTVYYIGRPPEPPEPPPDPEMSPNQDRLDLAVVPQLGQHGRRDLRISSSLLGGKVPQKMQVVQDDPDPGPDPGAIVTDPEYRAFRLHSLMRDAARRRTALAGPATQPGRTPSD